jgi:hypothetical protein
VAEEGQVLLRVVADREGVVVARAQEAVHRAAVHLRPPALPRVVRVRVVAALEVGGEAGGLVRLAGPVDVGEPRLPAVGAREPAEVVVERAVLHHQDDEGVDRQVARGGQRRAALLARGLGHERLGVQDGSEPGGKARRDRGALEELAAAVVRLGRGRLEPLGLVRVAQVPHGSGS